MDEKTSRILGFFDVSSFEIPPKAPLPKGGCHWTLSDGIGWIHLLRNDARRPIFDQFILLMVLPSKRSGAQLIIIIREWNHRIIDEMVN
jgi:hypothetical protein